MLTTTVTRRSTRGPVVSNLERREDAVSGPAVPGPDVSLRIVLGLALLWGAHAAPLAAQAKPVPQLFHTADQCMACHNQLTAPSGEDVSMGFAWRSSMMGNAGRDPYWMASVRRETLDHPSAVAAIEDKCTVCHLPMGRTQGMAEGVQGKAFENFPVIGAGGPYTVLAQDGVSCTVCHQVQDRNLGGRESFTGGYSIDLATPMGQRWVYGPFEVDDGRTRVMRSSSEFVPRESAHIQSAEFCASCHTLFTHALNPAGEEVGELPEQVPYLEWKHSAYAGNTTCQDCHMPVIEGEVSVTGVLPNLRRDVNRHTFQGGNFLMPRMLNRYRAEMGVTALPQELDATARLAAENLATQSARVRVDPVLSDGRLAVDVSIENLVGHKLPSGYPSRRAWIHLAVRDGNGRVVFESGAFQADGSIAGNVNDSDGTRFEPHYTEITSPNQVQIYENVMVDHAGAVTTGLLQGVRYVKDNRLLPDGFDKATAPWDVAVHGEALADADFVGGGDVVRYLVEVGAAPGPFTVEAGLWYQPIGYRWARNLAEYSTRESARFVGYFDSMAASSATLVARDAATAQ
jgi:hypothetical protein